MARKVSTQRKVVATIAAWAIAFLIFFPILYTVITSFKTEAEAIAGISLVPSGTFENYVEVQSQRDYFKPFMNSVIISIGSTLIALAIAIPAAWSMAFSPTRRTKDILMWMLSTKMMPAVGVLVPMYLIFRDTGLLDTRLGLADEAVLLGTGMVAATASGLYPSLAEACVGMQQEGRERVPDPATRGLYDRDYRIFLEMHRQRKALDEIA